MQPTPLRLPRLALATALPALLVPGAPAHAGDDAPAAGHRPPPPGHPTAGRQPPALPPGGRCAGSDVRRTLNAGDVTPGAVSRTVVETSHAVVTPHTSAVLAPGSRTA